MTKMHLNLLIIIAVLVIKQFPVCRSFLYRVENILVVYLALFTINWYLLFIYYVIDSVLKMNAHAAGLSSLFLLGREFKE